jgi:DNA replication protein DnaC
LTASNAPNTATPSNDELQRIERYGLIVVDEIGYLPLERQAANLLFARVARRFDRA